MPSGSGTSAINTILQSGNTTRIAKARYEQAVQTQVASNKLKKAQTDLSTWSRSLSNKRRVNAAGDSYSSAMERLQAQVKNAGKQTANLDLAHSARIGEIRARSALAGVGGSTVDLMDHLVTLQTATSIQEVEQSVADMLYFTKDQAASVVADAYKGQDFSQDFTMYDTVKYQEPKDLKYKWGKLVGIAAAYIWGGQAAGDMAANGTVADWKASNGDFDGAVSSYTAAANSGLDMWRDYAARSQRRREDTQPQAVQRENVKIYNPGANTSTSSGRRSWFNFGD